MTKTKLTIEEWKIIGKKAKEINKAQMELVDLLSGRLPKTAYLDKWQTANKSFGKLRTHLDDIVCGEFRELPDREITSIFYGDEK